MMWGKGDTSRLGEEEITTLGQLRRMVETGHIVALNPEQSEMLKRALDWYETWESTFKLLGSIRNTAVLIGFFITIWIATEGSILDFIKGFGR